MLLNKTFLEITSQMFNQYFAFSSERNQYSSFVTAKESCGQ